jgi:hypothetical protein
MDNTWFRILDEEEEEFFRAWARENWEDIAPDPCWHPVVRDEWEAITRGKHND